MLAFSPGLTHLNIFRVSGEIEIQQNFDWDSQQRAVSTWNICLEKRTLLKITWALHHLYLLETPKDCSFAHSATAETFTERMSYRRRSFSVCFTTNAARTWTIRREHGSVRTIRTCKTQHFRAWASSARLCGRALGIKLESKDCGKLLRYTSWSTRACQKCDLFRTSYAEHSRLGA